MAEPLPADQVDRYRRDGYTVVPGVLDAGELAWLRTVFDGLFQRRGELASGEFYDVVARPDEPGHDEPRDTGLLQIIGAEKHAPELLAAPHFARCRAIAAALLETPAAELDVFVHLMLKLASTGPETPWHQDEAYMDPAWERAGLSLWMPLDTASVDSGCLHFVAGSHRGAVVEHRHVAHDDRVRALTTDLVDAAGGVACPLAAGDASAHDFRTLHYAGPNRTSEPRRAYVLVFTTRVTPAERPDARPWL